VLIAVLTFATLMAIRGVLKRTLGKVAARTSSKLDDLVVALIGHTQGFVLFVLALYAGSLALSLTRNEIRIAGMAVALAILVQIGLWGNLIIGYAPEHALHRRQEEDPDPGSDGNGGWTPIAVGRSRGRPHTGPR
jgi:hypothetical protein